MAFDQEIEKLIIDASKKESPHFVANVINFQQFDQNDVKDTAQKLIDDGIINATLHFHYKELCTITFIADIEM